MSDKATLVALFEQGDVPTGTNFADMINSSVNIAQSGLQTMIGSLSTTELLTPRVSATNVNATTVSANTVVTDNILVTGISANTVYASAAKFSTGIVSAAGTAQAAGSPLIYTINRGAGVADGQTTGFLLPNNQVGRVQYIINGGASANLWPASECVVNVLATNAAFAMAANTLYTILHVTNSAYAVK